VSANPPDKGGQQPAGPSAQTETQPTDSSIPQDWERSAQTAQEEPASEVKTVVRGTKTCRAWLVRRVIHGPKRNGTCTPAGALVLVPWYVGNCDWEIHQLQYGIANEYQLVNVIGVRITSCDDSSSEEIIVRMTPFWKNLGPHKVVCADTVITKVHGERPPILDQCPEHWQPEIHGGLPNSVKEALEREADKLKPTAPGVTTSPFPYGPPPPSGLRLFPAPTRDEMERLERERAQRESLDPFGGERESEEHLPGEEQEWVREARRLREKLRQDYELERDFERWLRETERDF
jgi:hypothetical protein